MHSTSFLQHLGKPISDEKRNINESLYTVCNACFCARVQLCSRFVYTFIPAEIIEFVDLKMKEIMSQRTDKVFKYFNQ